MLYFYKVDYSNIVKFKFNHIISDYLDSIKNTLLN